ncbi:hypothetical protein [Streptomyces sp. NPDC059753]|uniref:hypothetical protein n=1 Tax=Streptomyces sp. NPDC059753 TaxID=3346933 RepID=UPI003647357B
MRTSWAVHSLAFFATGHVIVALGSSFTLLLAARFLTAIATGAFWAVANVAAAIAAGPAASSRTLGLVGAGAMLANVVGVPLGAFAGQLMGWRALLGPCHPGRLLGWRCQASSVVGVTANTWCWRSRGTSQARSGLGRSGGAAPRSRAVAPRLLRPWPRGCAVWQREP